MTSLIHLLQRHSTVVFFGCAISLSLPAIAVEQSIQKESAATPVVTGPDLDLWIQHYSRVRTVDGVLRESRYEEKMIRRPGHVWISRVLPPSAIESYDGYAHENSTNDYYKSATLSGPQLKEHKHFNHVVLTRHVMRDGEKIRLEIINFHDREVVGIAPTEYENVNFDGSWANAFFLIDPKRISALPRSKRLPPSANSQWKSLEKNGLFQHVLWDDKEMVPLIVESGDQEGNFFERIDVKVQASVSTAHPWLNTKGFAQKDYTDFLD